jgi:Tfp pilus assembly protein PilF
VWVGRLAEGIRLLEQAVQPAENNVAVAAWKVALAEAYLVGGRIDQASDMASGAAALALQRKEVGFFSHALQVQGTIAARGGRVDEAAMYYRQALDIAAERGMLPLAARCHADLAVL